MFWFRPSFEEKFKRINGGWSSSKVRRLLGEPTEAEESKIPDGSVFGMQRAFAHKIQAGEPILQWLYQAEGFFHYIWFAKVGDNPDDPWLVALRVRFPRRL